MGMKSQWESTPLQQAYWSSLRAPLEHDDGGSGAVEHRLDEVVGPGLWEMMVVPSPFGMVVNLSLECPDDRDQPRRITRGGGSALAGEPGVAEAFRAAARRLGIPAPAAEPARAAPRATTPAPRPAPPVPAPAPRSAGVVLPPPPYGAAGTARAYSWAIEVRKLTGLDVLRRMEEYARKSGRSIRCKDWDPAFHDEVLSKANRIACESTGARPTPRPSADGELEEGEVAPEPEERPPPGQGVILPARRVPPALRAQVEADPFVRSIREHVSDDGECHLRDMELVMVELRPVPPVQLLPELPLD